MGFLEDQNAATVDPRPGLAIDLNVEVIRHTACIFFVPSKLRAYRDELHPILANRVTIPPPSYDLLARTYAPFGLKVVDLTPLLKQAAQIELANGNYVYWRDDTHWNGRGVAAVVSTVAECVRQHEASGSPSNIKVSQWEYVFDGQRLSIGGTGIAIQAIDPDGIDGVAQDNQSYLIEGSARRPEPKRVLAFVGSQLVSSVPMRAPHEEETLRFSDERESRFQLAIPRNLIEDSKTPIRIFAVFGEHEAKELAIKKEIAARLLR